MPFTPPVVELAAYRESFEMKPDHTTSNEGTEGRDAEETGSDRAGLWDVIRDLRRAQREAPPVQRVPRDATLPISFAQESLWFHYQLEPNQPLLNIFRRFSLSGPLNAEVLQRSLNEVIRRHDALRTTIITDNGRPLQKVNRLIEFNLETVDLLRFEPGARESEARRLARAEATRPFDLSQNPLLRASLLRLEEENHVLLLSTSHIVCDGWSLGILYRELSTIYNAFLTGDSSPLTDPPVQYIDFAVWQRERIKGTFLEENLGYWQKQLEGTSALEIPSDRPRPAVQSFQGSDQTFSLSNQLRLRLEALARRENATLFMVLLAAWRVLLKRYSGQDDIAVGTLIAGRQRPELEGIIGRFTNTLALHTDLSGDPTFRELLGRVRETALGAYAHQELPFEKLVEELRPERDPGRNPVFQTMFVFLNLPKEVQEKGLNLKHINAVPMPVSQGHARFDLMCNVWRDGDGLKGSLEYATDLFDAATIERIAKHYRRLLESVVADPSVSASELPMLGSEERRQILVQWNNTESDCPRDYCVHELFEQQVERTPNAVAVVHETENYTYEEVNARANRVAHGLRNLGVGPETLVGVCVERSFQLVSLLGILKAGGAYVPLDPDYPKERLAFMIRDSKARVIVTQERLLGRLPEEHEVKTLLVDADRPREARPSYSHANPKGRSLPGQLAYVIYTSGSTGTPKGVAIEHRSLVNHAVASALQYGVEAGDRVLQFASLSFDVAAEEMFPTMLSGGTLVLQPERDVLEYSAFSRFVDEQRLTILNLPAAYWHRWVHELAQSGAPVPQCLRLLVVGSDKVSPQSLSTWHELSSNLQIRWINAYGPTEATVTSTTHYSLWKHRDQSRQSVPIGRPIANVQVYLLDRHLEPVPVGITGELYIGGAGVARGYLGKPALTAERFIPDPFSNEPGVRLYKTGDLGRYMPSGNIEFLGREDQQVKVRGFRVELGETETVLESHPKVRGAVVVTDEEGTNEGRLVAYVSTSEDEVRLVADLRDYLKERLPYYMIPSVFVILEDFPLAPNGKVDMATLPEPGTKRLTSKESFVAPRSVLEKDLADIWIKVLGVEPIGVHDNFFDLGGHSLSATQVVSQARHAFKVELPLRSIFEAPTVESLSEYVQTLQWVVNNANISSSTLGDEREEGQL